MAEPTRDRVAKKSPKSISSRWSSSTRSLAGVTNMLSTIQAENQFDLLRRRITFFRSDVAPHV